MNPTCPYCGDDLIEVDNPVRAEVRHRRGRDAHCPGAPAAATMAFVEPRPTREQAMAGQSDPPALAACPVCSETWWIIRRTVQVAAAEFTARRSDAEPQIVAQRAAVVCGNCGYSPP